MQEDKLRKISQMIAEVEKVILGKRDVVELMVAALLAGGHVLFEDIPGVGKTLMVKTLAKTIQGSFSRVQFTPDLLPSDILGVSIFNNHTNEFEFRQGPIFTSVLLADEINRATPRTQAALLEAMSENRVTIDNHTYALPSNFFVLATQNPIDYEGTYPLPEAQLDRFLFRLRIGYPEREDELRLIMDKPRTEGDVRKLFNEAEISDLKTMVDEVFVHEQVARYALELVVATRNDPAIALGISPRGSMAFMRGAKAYALTQGRNFVSPEDLQKVLPAVFGHRIKLTNGNQMISEIDTLLERIVTSIPVPMRR